MIDFCFRKDYKISVSLDLFIDCCKFCSFLFVEFTTHTVNILSDNLDAFWCVVDDSSSRPTGVLTF